MNEPPEGDVLLIPPRDVKKSHLVNFSLIAYAYLFYANMICVGAFYNYFDYMRTRGSVSSIPDPIPSDDDPFRTPSAGGVRTFPAGYTSSQLLFAWTWNAHPDSPLGKDQLSAVNAASSVYFVTVVIAQMGHLLSIRTKTPYFAEEIMGKEWIANRLQHTLQPAGNKVTQTVDRMPEREHNDDFQRGAQSGRGLMISSSDEESPAQPEATVVPSPNHTTETISRVRSFGLSLGGMFAKFLRKIRWSIILAWMGSIAVALIVTEVPFIQTYGGTAAVSGKYWGYAFGWSAAWFTAGEIRKWIIVLFPHSRFSQFFSW